MASHRKAKTGPSAATGFLDAGRKRTVINNGVPDGSKSTCFPERVRANKNTTAGCHSESWNSGYYQEKRDKGA